MESKTGKIDINETVMELERMVLRQEILIQKLAQKIGPNALSAAEIRAAEQTASIEVQARYLTA